MKISFSYNQICQIQLAAVRRQEAYDLVRSYLGIPCGTLFDNFDLVDALAGDTFLKFSKDSAVHISIRGVEIDLEACLHATRTLIAIDNIQTRLNALDVSQPGSLTALRRVVKHAKLMIDGVEW